MASFQEPFDVVLQPVWNTTTAHVMPGFRHSSVSSPNTRSLIPKGVSYIQCDNQTRFVATIKFMRGETERELGTIPLNGTAFLKAIFEVDTEVWVTIAGTPNTNDQGATRIGLKVIPGNSGGVGGSLRKALEAIRRMVAGWEK